MAVMLKMRSNNERRGALIVSGICLRDAGSNQDGQLHSSKDIIQLVGTCRITCRRTGDNKAVGEEELGRFCRLRDAHIGGDRMRTVLLFDIRNMQFVIVD